MLLANKEAVMTVLDTFEYEVSNQWLLNL